VESHDPYMMALSFGLIDLRGGCLCRGTDLPATSPGLRSTLQENSAIIAHTFFPHLAIHYFLMKGAKVL
jgi:hypothetical protein